MRSIPSRTEMGTEVCLHPVEAPKEFHAAGGKRIRLLRDRNLDADIGEPVVMFVEIGWSLSGHSALSCALESRVSPPLLIEQDGRLVQALFEILFAVLQRFDAPLQQEIALLQARRVRRFLRSAAVSIFSGAPLARFPSALFPASLRTLRSSFRRLVVLFRSPALLRQECFSTSALWVSTS